MFQLLIQLPDSPTFPDKAVGNGPSLFLITMPLVVKW